MIVEETEVLEAVPLKKKEPIAGFLLINKPVWLSSFAVVRKLRELTRVKKIGHAGTLDPFATGLLIVAIGKTYTKRVSEIQELPKEYIATMVLGVETDTYDCDGRVKQVKMLKNTVVTDKMVNDAMAPFIGDFMQEPPLYSAKRVGGKRAYKLARRGRDITLDSSPVSVTDIALLDVKNGMFPECTVRINCSKGTYVRALIRDISKGLGTCGFAKELIRTKIGEYDVKQALNLQGLTRKKICENLIKL